MSFGQPFWFWGFALLPILLFLYLRHESRRRKLLGQLVAARLFDRLAGTVSLFRRRLRLLFVLLGLAALIISLAQPRYGYTWEENKREGLDILVAIDCSRSMLATDLTPSRLARAKLTTQDLIAQLPGDRIGLIAFAGTAFLQAPLTIDYGAVLNSLDELDTNIIPRGGTNIAAAITEADAAFGKGESENRCLILFTDGEELEADALAAAEAVKDHMRIFTVGLGSADGALIPLPDQNGGTAFVKDDNGEFVKSRLDEPRLQKIAETTGGFYVHLLNGPPEMQKIIRDGLGQMKEKEFEARMSRRPIERYQWPLSAALVLLTLSTVIKERKRLPRRAPAPAVAAVVAVLVALLLIPPAARAVNSGVEAYNREDYAGAMSEFDRQLQQQRESAALNFDLGAAAYKSGQFDKALEAFSKAVTSPDPALHSAAEYNLGNTLFQQGAALEKKEAREQRWKDALQHYGEALKVNPQNKDAEYNRDVVRKLLEEKQEPPSQQQQQNKKNGDDQQNQQNQQQQQQSQGGQGKQDQQQQQQQSQGGQGKQDQQQQNQQSQNQQSQGSSGQQQSQDQKSGSQQDKSQEGKDGQQKQPQPQNQGGEKKDEKSKSSQGDEQSPQPSPESQGQPLTPEQKEALKKLSEGVQPQANGQTADPQKEAAAEAEAAKEGRMTEAQARQLLESMKDEDVRVQLSKPPNEKPLSRKFRDW